MNATTQLHALGQNLWLDNITRELLDSGTLQRYCTEYSITGLTSNPTIFNQAIGNTTAYDKAIHQKVKEGKSGEALFFELALEDLKRAAALFMPAHQVSGSMDGWVSLEVSPLLANDAAGTVAEARRLHAQAQCPNLFIKIPGTQAGVQAIEESIFHGVPVNVTLLFSREHYVAAADAYWRGIRRRIDAGLDPKVNSVASIFISRWDKAIADKVPDALRNRLGVAVAQQAYKAYVERQASPAWHNLSKAGALPQLLLWASTGTKDPAFSDTFYIQALAAALTINTIPEKTLLAFADHGQLTGVLSQDGGDAEQVLADFARAGIDTVQLAAQLQTEGAESFSKSWRELLQVIASKSQQLSQTVPPQTRNKP